MELIHGVQVETDADGEYTQVSIDLREHKAAIPKLKEMGLLPSIHIISSDEETMTLEEFDKGLQAVITEYYANTR